LRQNLQALQAIVMPRPEMFVVHNELKFDGNGNLTDDETRTRLKTWLEAYLKFLREKP
jgi:NAD(P)H-dependent FMN reductase